MNFGGGGGGRYPLKTKSGNRSTKQHYASSSNNTPTGDFMHTVLYGPPGTGKTEVAKILGNIFCHLGILKANTFKKVTRSDLIAGYLGQTAIKTREVIDSAIGGVLFIDEAYALGNTEKRDSFSKECIDTLCEALSDHKHELMVIIAGYEKELTDCFFSYNEGLSSRFTWRYKIDNYSAVDLRKIFEKIVRDNRWTFKEVDSVKDAWFKQHYDYFKYFGRDIEVFFTKTKIAHSRRVFCRPSEQRRSLNMKDLETGFELFSQNEDVKSRGNRFNGISTTLYL
jgi:SpoVK/Ycf46/Vps4 family AAA+-type ATPase